MRPSHRLPPKPDPRGRPWPYFIEFESPVKIADLKRRLGDDYDATDIREQALDLLDMRDVESARRQGKAVADRLETHVAIYARRDLEQIDPPTGPWTYEVEWMEDIP